MPLPMPYSKNKLGNCCYREKQGEEQPEKSDDHDHVDRHVPDEVGEPVGGL